MRILVTGVSFCEFCQLDAATIEQSVLNQTSGETKSAFFNFRLFVVYFFSVIAKNFLSPNGLKICTNFTLKFDETLFGDFRGVQGLRRMK